MSDFGAMRSVLCLNDKDIWKMMHIFVACVHISPLFLCVGLFAEVAVPTVTLTECSPLCVAPLCMCVSYIRTAARVCAMLRYIYSLTKETHELVCIWKRSSGPHGLL